MAQNTDKTLMHKLIYSVFVRNHTPEGTFRALEGDLDRLRALGTDIVWLMPIHPIGKEGRKGTLGSPTPSGTTGASTRSTAPWRTSAIWWTPSTTAA